MSLVTGKANMVDYTSWVLIRYRVVMTETIKLKCPTNVILTISEQLCGTVAKSRDGESGCSAKEFAAASCGKALVCHIS